MGPALASALFREQVTVCASLHQLRNPLLGVAGAGGSVLLIGDGSERGAVLERTGFEQFVADVEPRLRRALVGAYGPQRGSDALAAALAYAWTNWDRIQLMEFPAAYLYRVGQSETRPRRERVLRDDHVVGIEHWVEPRLLSELRRLSPRQRTAVVLVHAFDWSVAEVAELTGIAPTTVHNHLRRGLERLRNRLDNDDV